MARRKTEPPAWTPNQIVAFNLAKARLKRGWTQDQAAEAVAPYLGARLSAASWSAIERSIDGGRIREITADELVAFARGFALPLGWFLTPPPSWEGVGIATPDTRGRGGLDPYELFDVIIGTPDTLAEWGEYLLSWPASGHRVRIRPDGTMENLGRIDEDVHPRLADPTALRARLLLHERFGDIDNARHVLEALCETLDALDEPAPADTKQEQPAAKRGRRKE